MQKPYNWRTDYDWTDPNDEPVDETIIDETELMLPKDARGLDSLREGENTRVATSGPSHRISELIRRYNDGTITEEEKIELEMLMEMTPTMAQGGRIGYAWRGKVNLGDKFSLKERLIPRDPQNELIAEHMQIGKLPANITRRILALNKGGKSYEDIAQLTGVEIEDINSILNVANKPDIIDPVDKSGKVDYDLWDDIVTENISIRDRPEHLDYIMRGQKMLADGGRIDKALPTQSRDI